MGNKINDPIARLMGLRYKSHPWHGIEVGDNAPEIVTAFIEMVPTDTVKYELDKVSGYIRIDRPQKYSTVVPALYGFIPQSFCGDTVARYCMERCGRTDEAADSFARGSAGDCQPAAAVYYNDQKPHKLFYQGLSLRKLGREAEARGCFHRLVDFGEQHLHDVFHMDYFAVSLPDLQLFDEDLTVRNRAHCEYLIALGSHGLGDPARAAACFPSPSAPAC